MSPSKRFHRGLAFVGLNVSLVGVYCYSMVGRLEPLKHGPVRFVILPLMMIGAVVSAGVFPVLRRQPSRWNQAVSPYLGFVLASAIYGGFLWALFPDGSPWTVPLAMVGAHLYGFSAFLAVLVGHFLLGPWLLRQTGPSGGPDP